MSDEPKKTPVDTLREASLNAKIWENQHDNGVHYKTTFSRSYQDQEGQWRQTNSFGEKDLLPLSNLASRSHDAVRELREQERAQQREKETQERLQTDARESARNSARGRAREADRER